MMVDSIFLACGATSTKEKLFNITGIITIGLNKRFTIPLL